MKLLFILGTRPEVIKLAPVINLVKSDAHCEVFVCNTGQHKEMLQQACEIFDIQCDVDLDVMASSNGNLSLTASSIMSKLEPIVAAEKPDWIIVQGDTISAFAGGMVGYFNKIKVGHVEAGLRSHDIYHPFPEEVNRKLISTFAYYHFVPTELSRQNLVKENIALDTILNTGNTVIDALMLAKEKIDGSSELKESIAKKMPFIDETKNIILLTAHRRENHQYGLEQICRAVKHIAKERSDVQFIFPVHLNPAVKNMAYSLLTDIPNVVLIEPLDYLSIVYLLAVSKLILTDSGGIQEEATAFGTPVLVLREKTERMEGVIAGMAKLVGTNSEIIIESVNDLLDCKATYDSMCQGVNPYGDGFAAVQILHHLKGALFKEKKNSSKAEKVQLA